MQARNEPEEDFKEVRSKSMQAMKLEKGRISDETRETSARAGRITVRAKGTEPVKLTTMKPKAGTSNSNQRRAWTEEAANKTKAEEGCSESKGII